MRIVIRGTIETSDGKSTSIHPADVTVTVDRGFALMDFGSIKFDMAAAAARVLATALIEAASEIDRRRSK